MQPLRAPSPGAAWRRRSGSGRTPPPPAAATRGRRRSPVGAAYGSTPNPRGGVLGQGFLPRGGGGLASRKGSWQEAKQCFCVAGVVRGNLAAAKAANGPFCFAAGEAHPPTPFNAPPVPLSYPPVSWAGTMSDER